MTITCTLCGEVHEICDEFLDGELPKRYAYGRQQEVIAALTEALKYPRFRDTAGLLEKIADDMDEQAGKGWTPLYALHLRTAAADMRAALRLAAEVEEGEK